jgi:hypothetical protein
MAERQVQMSSASWNGTTTLSVLASNVFHSNLAFRSLMNVNVVDEFVVMVDVRLLRMFVIFKADAFRSEDFVRFSIYGLLGVLWLMVRMLMPEMMPVVVVG